MTGRPLPDRDTLLMMLSAFLDGELSAADESLVFDAMSQDPELLEAFEALSAQHGLRAELTTAESDALTASVLAATAPSEMPATVEGALGLASLLVDDCLDANGDRRLDAILQSEPAAPEVLAGFVASGEALQVAARGVSSVPSVAAALRHIPDHVDAQVAARERAFVLASGALDDALTPAEAAELDGLLPVHGEDLLSLTGASYATEGLRVAFESPAFARFGQKAGEAALHAIEAERLQQAAPALVAASPPALSVEPLVARLWRAFTRAAAPVGFAAAAAAVFFAVSGPAPKPIDVVAERDANQKALFDALAPRVLGDTPDTDLPVLADNSADVEALDATNTTVVFSTAESNITVIWVDDSEQGT